MAPRSAPCAPAATRLGSWLFAPDDDAATKEKKKKLPKLAESNHYSIFVAGLSNGWALSDPVGDEKDPVVRRKTLQLTFNRVGDQYYMKSDEIRFKSSEWIYRASKLKLNLPLLDKKAKKDKDEKEKAKDKDD